jgi:hypothetical protein
MADFAVWATACETALWPGGSFWSAYGRNRDEAVEGVIEADPVAAAVRLLMAARTVWTGTASDLLAALTEGVDERIAKSKTWPDSPRALAGRLRRAATFLRKIGIEVTFKREGKARSRIIHIEAAAPEKGGALASAPSAPSATSPEAARAIELAPKPGRTVTGDANGHIAPIVRPNAFESNPKNAADGADAKSASQSAAQEPPLPGWRMRV